MQDITIETIGCDLGDKWTSVCVLGVDGLVSRTRVRTTRTAIRGFFERSCAHIIMEVGGHSRWVSAIAQEQGHRVTVANPRRVKLITQAHTKTDRRDAELLARLGRADVSLLAPIRHRGPEVHTQLAILKARDLLVRTRTQLVGHIKAVVKSTGERLPSAGAACFHRKARLHVPATLHSALDPLFDVLEQLDSRIRAYERTIRTMAKEHPGAVAIQTINGVGPITALAFVLTVEDPDRFTRSRMAGAFFGLTPRRSQSGTNDPQLQITKAGDPFVRKLVVNCANYILGPFGKDSDLKRFGLRLAESGGKNARHRAKVALARKLCVLMHRLWVTGQPYVPSGYCRAA